VVRLRVGHHRSAERAGGGEAALESARGSQSAHAAGVPAAVHVRMCRMQSAREVSMLC